MKKIGFIIFAAALIIGVVIAGIASFGGSIVNIPFSIGSKVHGSGNVVIEARETEEFEAVEVSGILNVEIQQSKRTSVVVVADDNILPLIKTEVSGGVLKISSESKFKSPNRVVIRVSAPSIKELKTSGVAKVHVKGIDSESLSISSSGASKVSISGTTKELELDMSGASHINAGDLKVDKANVEGSGASSAEVDVTTLLDADLSGASDLTYKGEPAEIKKSVSGASNLKKAE